jgi:mono/diheme cytochrome c family protein
MRKRTIALSLAVAAGALIAGCGLARPGGAADDVPADVQAVFKKHCVRCHTGAAPPRGLLLIREKAGAVVGAPSAERPDLLLVAPGKPEASYLLMKVRGDEGIQGKRMPIGEILSDEELKVLEAWVAGLAK